MMAERENNETIIEWEENQLIEYQLVFLAEVPKKAAKTDGFNRKPPLVAVPNRR